MSQGDEPRGLLHALGGLWKHRDLIRQFARREVEGRYRGSFLGLFWSILNPIVLLVIYTFVFGVVFKARWPQSRSPESLAEFALVIFCGITVYTLFAEPVGRAPGLVVGVPNFVKKVVFPLEILPVSMAGAALFHAAIGFALVVAGRLLMGGPVPATALLLPVVILPLVLLSLGVSWFLSSLGVYVRDLGYGVTLVLQVLFFLSSIFYPAESVPPPFGAVLAANPITPAVDGVRDVLLWGRFPDPERLAVSGAVGLVVALAGLLWFQRTRKGFGDVL